MLRLSDYSKKVITLVSGTASAQVISVLMVPVLTRLYSVEEFGILALLMTFVNLWVGFHLFRYEQAFFIVKRKAEQSHLIVETSA